MRISSFFPARGARRTLLAALVAAGCGASVQLQAATTDGTAEARVVRPITITAVNTLRFGAFSTSAADQTVTISTAGARSNSGTLLVATSVAAIGQATFTVGGEGSLSYNITLPGSTIDIETAGGGATEVMSVGGFVSDPATSGTLNNALGAAGTQTLNVGATVTTVANQAPGAYTGTFPVTVEYQ